MNPLTEVIAELGFLLAFVDEVPPSCNGYSTFQEMRQALYDDEVDTLFTRPGVYARLFGDLVGQPASHAVTMTNDMVYTVLDVVKRRPKMREAVIEFLTQAAE